MKKKKRLAAQAFIYYLTNINKAREIAWASVHMDKKNIGFLTNKKNEKFPARDLVRNYDKELIQKIKFDLPYEITKLFYEQSWKLGSNIKPRSLFCNQSLVMLVSAFEIFLKNLFIDTINEDPKLQRKILLSKRKVSFLDFKQYNERKVSLGELISRNYNFQNLNSVIDAYKFINIDIRSVLEKRVKIDGKTYKISKEIERAIKKRHKIVHEAYNYNNLTVIDLEIYWHVFNLAGVHLEMVPLKSLFEKHRKKLKKKK